jgi:hypothetical protein
MGGLLGPNERDRRRQVDSRPSPVSVCQTIMAHLSAPSDLLISTALTARLDAIDCRDRTARGHAGT